MYQPSWVDANFYLISDDFQYTIRGEVVLEHEIDIAVLQHAVDKAFIRYPYFSVQVELWNSEYVLIPNLRPHNVICGKQQIVLGSEDVNYHLIVVSCYENRILFHVSHSITDGIGRAPFTKTVLYYYLSEKYGIELDTDGIRLAESNIMSDECGEPFPVKELMKAEPSGYRSFGYALKAADAYGIQNRQRCEYRFHTDEEKWMDLCRRLNASPNSLLSVLLARTVWKGKYQSDTDIVINLCLNMRPALLNRNSHLMLLGNIPMIYPPSWKDLTPDQLTLRTRKMIDDQKVSENVRYLCRKNILEFDKIRKMNSLKMRTSVMQSCIRGKGGFLSSTFSISYVGKNNMGSLSPYVKEMYTSVDAVPEGGAMIEITNADRKFFFTWLQDFTDDTVIRSFMQDLESFGVPVSDPEACQVLTPLIRLP